jgi:hypothetical protein
VQHDSRMKPRDTKEMFTARLSPLVKQIIKAEAEESVRTEADVIEEWAFICARSSQGRALLSAAGQKDWRVAAIIDAARRRFTASIETGQAGAEKPRRSKQDKGE